MYLRRTSIVAIFFVLLLRTAIGWQLFYEGLWKIKTLSTPHPWTAAGYLKNSQGPLRTTFRKMAGDPNELDWLDADKVAERWTNWQSRFEKHYGLDERQSNRLANLVIGPKAFYSDAGKLTEIPDGVELDSVRVIKFDPEKKRLEVDGKRHLSGKEYTKLLQMGDADDESVRAFREQLEKVYLRSSNLSYLEQLHASLLGNPDWVGMKTKEGDVQQMGELSKYRNMIDDYETSLASAEQDFQYEHLQKMWSDLQAHASRLSAPSRRSKHP